MLQCLPNLTDQRYDNVMGRYHNSSRDGLVYGDTHTHTHIVYIPYGYYHGHYRSLPARRQSFNFVQHDSTDYSVEQWHEDSTIRTGYVAGSSKYLCVAFRAIL